MAKKTETTEKKGKSKPVKGTSLAELGSLVARSTKAELQNIAQDDVSAEKASVVEQKEAPKNVKEQAFIKTQSSSSNGVSDLVSEAVNYTVDKILESGCALPGNVSSGTFRLSSLSASRISASENLEIFKRAWKVNPTSLRKLRLYDNPSEEVAAGIYLPYGSFVNSLRFTEYDLLGVLDQSKLISDSLVTAELAYQNEIVANVKQYFSKFEKMSDESDVEFRRRVLLSPFVTGQDLALQTLVQQYLSALLVISEQSSLAPVKASKANGSLSSIDLFASRILNSSALAGSTPASLKAGKKFMLNIPTFPIPAKRGLSRLSVQHSANTKLAEILVFYFMEKVRINEIDLKPRLNANKSKIEVIKKRPVIKDIRIRLQGEKILASSIEEGYKQNREDKEGNKSAFTPSYLPLDLLVKKYSDENILDATLVGTTLLVNVYIPQWLTKGLTSYDLAKLEGNLSREMGLSTDQVYLSAAALSHPNDSGKVDFRRRVISTPGWDTFTWDENRRVVYFRRDETLFLEEPTPRPDQRALKGDNFISPFTLEGSAEIVNSLSGTQCYPRGLATFKGDNKERDNDSLSANRKGLAEKILKGGEDEETDLAVTLGGHPVLNRTCQFLATHWLDVLLVCYSTRFRDQLEINSQARTISLSANEFERILTHEYLEAMSYAGWVNGEDRTGTKQVFFGRFKS